MKLIWQCLFSPKLYKIYRDGSRDSMYQPYSLEKWSDKVICTTKALLNLCIYTSPIICIYIYRRGFFTADEFRFLAKIAAGISCLMAVSYLLRSVGRCSNPKYVKFIKTLSHNTMDSKESSIHIRKYDFEFYAWPPSYVMTHVPSNKWLPQHPFTQCANPDLPLYQRVPIQVLAYFATHTFGLRLVYPGSLGIVQTLLSSALMQGRTQLVEVLNGERAKIVTADGNYLDTMFVDNRTQDKGKNLVICCEGNSGFYEIGIMLTPIKAGFSALGWNHPGFAGSTGVPFPAQERSGIDAVLQYAINELGFEPENIIMFGWSIGGYTATWAAVNYNVKALILDATFDDLLPLAENQMPSSWKLLVKEVIRSYIDLDVAKLIVNYTGPTMLIRRTEDEVISLEAGQVASNRGNNLLIKLIESRNPNLTSEEKLALSKFVPFLDNQRAIMEKGRLADNMKGPLSLISKYLYDYKSTHCTPLPEENFALIASNLMERK